MSDKFKRRKSKCYDCPYRDLPPSKMTEDELAYARCTNPEDFHCHTEGGSHGYGYGDGETMCRGHWEAFYSAVKKSIEADESAGDRIDWESRTPK